MKAPGAALLDELFPLQAAGEELYCSLIRAGSRYQSGRQGNECQVPDLNVSSWAQARDAAAQWKCQTQWRMSNTFSSRSTGGAYG